MAVIRTFPERLSVLEIVMAYGWRGGHMQVLLLSRSLRELGHDCRIVAPGDSELAHHARQAGVPVEPLPLRFELDPANLFRFRRFLRHRRPHVVHIHTSSRHYLGWYARHIHRTPVTVITRRQMNRIRFPLKYRISSHRVIAVSRAVAGVCVASGIPPERVDVVYDGIDPGRFDEPRDPRRFRSELGLCPDSPLLVTTSALVKEKALATLLRAFAELRTRLPDAHLAVVGSGGREAELRAEAQTLALGGAVTFTGFRTDVPDILAAADLYVQSSRHEGLCSSIVDAMLMSRPVVATRVGGVPEVVQENVTGLLVPPEDPGALAGALERVLTDPAERARMGASGRERAAREFTLDRMVAGNLAVYRRIWECPSGGSEPPEASLRP